jgi:hypothetical protein
MDKLTKEEIKTCQSLLEGSPELTPEQADIAFRGISKLYSKAAFYRKTWKCEMSGGGGSFWSIHEEKAQEKFDQMVEKSKNQEVILYESCQGKDTPVKKYKSPEPSPKKSKKA